MHSFSILTTLALAASALAGSATIVNNCDHDVYLWTAGDNTSPMTTIQAGKNHTEEYVTRIFGGISMKLSKESNIAAGQPVAQLEYTSLPGNLWYDLSLIDGDPFASAITTITPKAGETASCTPIHCPAGLTSCADAYMKSNDNFATHACPANTDLVMEICAAPESLNTKRDTSRAHARDFSI